MRIPKKLLIAGVVVLSASIITPAASGAAEPEPVLQPDDWAVPTVVDGDAPVGSVQDLFDEDPTGLVPKTPFVQRYSLDQDRWEVWLCGSVSSTMTEVIAALEAASVDYFDALSGGSYEPVFSAGGSQPADPGCLPEFRDGTYPMVGTPEGILIVDSVTGGGFASPGSICLDNNADCPSIPSTFPGNGRYAVVGEGALLSFPSVAVHELGHALQWPHSNSGSGDEYDNPLDLMSGNSTTGGSTEPDPYATLSYNRLQSGWVTSTDVVLANGTFQSLTLQPFDVPGIQLFAIETSSQGRFYVFGARTTSTHDPLPSAWQGVEVYEVDYYCDEPAFGGGICPGLFRSHTQQPPSPAGLGHVLQPGESIEIEGVTVTITAATGTGYTLTSDPDPGAASEPSAPGTPTASSGNEQASLTWTAAADGGSVILGYDVEVENRDGGGSTVSEVGLTLSTVATGLSNGTTYRARVRATNAIGDGPWSGWSADFTPGTVPGAPGTPQVSAGGGSIGVSWLAPTSNGGSSVTNYQLQLEDRSTAASFVIVVGTARSHVAEDLESGHLYRVRVRAENAFGVGAWSSWSESVLAASPTQPPAQPPSPNPPPVEPPITFIDEDGSVFEADIEWLAATGVTRGCNPPVNDRFCPNDTVTRGQMAAFLVRALGLSDKLDDPFVDDDISVFEADIERLAASGITRGCNPPVDDRFCPEDPVTRGQMAAFLVRAFGYSSDGGGDLFVDDDGSVFRADIDRLATAGVTRGCNPPVNDRFCPTDVVSRGQMAAFLHRALG